MEYLWTLNKGGIFLDETLCTVSIAPHRTVSSVKAQQQAPAPEMDVPCHHFRSPISAP